MKAKNIIFGTLALAIIGGGAFFYFKSKKKSSLEKDKLKSLGDLPTANSTSNTGTVATTDKVLYTASSINTQAQTLVIEILTLKNKYASLQGATPKCNAPLFGQNREDFSKCQLAKLQILDIQNKLTKLGYKEDNGVAVKL